MKNKIVIIELIFSLIIFIAMFLAITMSLLKMRNSVNTMQNNAQVVNLATNILENIKSRNYIDLENYINGLSGLGIDKSVEGLTTTIVLDGENLEERSVFDVNVPKDYIVEINLTQSDEYFNVEKNVDVKIVYNDNRSDNEYVVSTKIQIENLKECNEPIITDEYFKELNYNLDDFDIIPIKYDNKLGTFVVTNADDELWYNYSNKQWAKVLIFSKDTESLQDLFIENGIVKDSIDFNNSNLSIDNFIYVWIPNFTMKDDLSYFRYSSSKKQIKMDVIYNEGNYLYLNRIGDEIKDYSEDCAFDGISGVWKKYKDEYDMYYRTFNKTKYGPINIH